jgi:serine/threonine protein phosphatase PrpC
VIVALIMPIKIECLSVKNSLSDKPNEDALRVDTARCILAIADGVSRLRAEDGTYPNPSPASAVALLLVDTAADFLTHVVDGAGKGCTETDCCTALRRANAAIADYNSRFVPHPDYGVNDLAGAVGICGAICNSEFVYAYIGDCLGCYFSGTESLALTINQTSGIEEYIRQNKRMPNLEQTIRREIRNNSSHPLAWGALTGERSAETFITTGRVSLSKGSRILLSSDGLLSILSTQQDLARLMTPQELIDATLELEAEGKVRTDDKTVIIAEIVE